MHDGRLLVDGGLVNPVPVSLFRALASEIVIAVDLGWDLVGRRATLPELQGAKPGAAQNALIDSIFGRFRERTLNPAQSPSLKDVLLTSLNIMQVRIRLPTDGIRGSLDSSEAKTPHLAVI